MGVNIAVLEDLRRKSNLKLKFADEIEEGGFYPSGILEVDRALAGGLPVGSLIECGVPKGKLGRYVILRFLAGLSCSLWIYPRALKVNAAAWRAQGIDLQKVQFIPWQERLAVFRPIFEKKLFQLIVIDDVILSKEEMTFLRLQAQGHAFSILLLQDFELDWRRGNVQAKLRFNCSFHAEERRFCLRVLKGGMEQEVWFRL